MSVRVCESVHVWHKQETWYVRCARWTSAILWWSVTTVTYHPPTYLLFYPSFYFQGYKMVQGTTAKRRNCGIQPNLTLYSRFYLCSILHSSVRQAGGHQGKGRVDHRVARVMTMAQCAAAVKEEDGNGEESWEMYGVYGIWIRGLDKRTEI